MKSPKIAGYAILVAVNALAIIAASKFGSFLPAVSAAIAVAVAVRVGQVGFLGITVVFLAMNLLVPAAVLYWMGLRANMDNPLGKLLEQYEWLYAVLPWLVAVLVYGALEYMRRRRSHTQSSGT